MNPPTPPLKCELEDCSGCTDRHSEGTHAMHTKQHPCPEGGDPNCGYCFPTTEPKHPDSCTASVKEPSYMHSEECPLRRSITKTKPYKSWEETWLEDVPTPSPVVEGEWKKELTVIAKNVFLLHSVPPQMREAFAVFILRVAKLITTLLHDEREKERERIVKMCEEMMKKEPKDIYDGEDLFPRKYNEALSSLRDKLTNNV